MFRRRVLAPLVLTLGLSFHASLAPAAVEATAEVHESTITIPMHDGVPLKATLALPATGGRHPTILVRTPYGRRQHTQEALFWASHGYAVVIQDDRGKWGSEGDYLPFLNEHHDGMTTLDWIAQQNWSDGSIGMWGSSYLAFSQLILASSGHPALKSILPISGWIQDDGAINRGGANHIMLSIPWILHEESQTKRSLAQVDLEELFEFLPLIDVFSSLGLESDVWNEEYDFEALTAYSAANIEIPVLHMTGWLDFVHDASLAIYQQARNGPAGHLQKLMIGPWIHDQFYTTYTEVGDEDMGPQSAMGRERLQQLALEWFDATLRGGTVDVEAWPQARVFVMGDNRWQDFDRWPPEDVRERKFFLGSSTGANSSAGDGSLSSSPPVVERYDAFLFDPHDPVPTYGGANFHFFGYLGGVKDQREIEEREDVLVYTSEPLQQDEELLGAARAVLYASSEGLDTDFTAKLVELRPDGYARIIEEGILRASYRNGRAERELLEPNEIYRLEIQLGSSAIRIPRDSRIRLEISSSNFPKYDRNPNTGEDPLEAATLQAVTQRVYHGGKFASHLILPLREQHDSPVAREAAP